MSILSKARELVGIQSEDCDLKEIGSKPINALAKGKKTFSIVASHGARYTPGAKDHTNLFTDFPDTIKETLAFNSENPSICDKIRPTQIYRIFHEDRKLHVHYIIIYCIL